MVVEHLSRVPELGGGGGAPVPTRKGFDPRYKGGLPERKAISQCNMMTSDSGILKTAWIRPD